jgi:dihydroorotate dehydrogenase
MYKLVRSLLFLFDAEFIHEISTKLIKLYNYIPFVSKLLRKNYLISDKLLEKEVFGIKFPNPVGLAAGFDKNASFYNDFRNFGFGFIEIGTVTPLPQEGNPKKRIFRLSKDKALINRLGFNNYGIRRIKKNLDKKRNIIVGANIGKNSFTKNEEAYKDYLKCYNELYPYADYFAINISSPNTKGLREFHNKSLLEPLIEKITSLNFRKPNPKPILLKISPDLSFNELDQIIEIVLDYKIDGIIATNTSISREGLISKNKDEAGGVSGKPINKRSNEIISYISKKSNKAFPIIGVGGIMSAADAVEKIKSGADLVQLYTGFIYKGPKLIRSINSALIEHYSSI